MADSVGDDLTRAVLARLDQCGDARFKSVMETLIRHLHDFVREVDLTPAEWMAAIEFLTETGQACNAQRQEFILLSDTIGVSRLVAALEQARTSQVSRGVAEATETCLGGCCREGGPDFPLGTDISGSLAGDPAFYAGRVTDTDGNPIPDALLDVCFGAGVYGLQPDGLSTMPACGRFRTDTQGRYWFWSIRPNHCPVPIDGPVGRMLDRMGRHPYRPGHVQVTVRAEGHAAVTTHLFAAGSDYLDSDAVFGVRESLIIDFDRYPPGEAPDGRRMTRHYWFAHFDFRLMPEIH